VREARSLKPTVRRLEDAGDRDFVVGIEPDGSSRSSWTVSDRACMKLDALLKLRVLVFRRIVVFFLVPDDTELRPSDSSWY